MNTPFPDDEEIYMNPLPMNHQIAAPPKEVIVIPDDDIPNFSPMEIIVIPDEVAPKRKSRKQTAASSSRKRKAVAKPDSRRKKPRTSAAEKEDYIDPFEEDDLECANSIFKSFFKELGIKK